MVISWYEIMTINTQGKNTLKFIFNFYGQLTAWQRLGGGRGLEVTKEREEKKGGREGEKKGGGRWNWNKRGEKGELIDGENVHRYHCISTSISVNSGTNVN